MLAEIVSGKQTLTTQKSTEYSLRPKNITVINFTLFYFATKQQASVEQVSNGTENTYR